MDERDGAAVAVADEQRPFDAEGGKDRRQAPFGLDMHVIEREGAAGRQRRPAIAEAGIDQRARACRCCHLVGKIAPEGRAAEPLMQEHQHRQVGVAFDQAVFDLAVVEGEPAVQDRRTAHARS